MIGSEEIGRFFAAVPSRWRAILTTAAFTGLRASELRGLRWEDVDLTKRELHVGQRADRFGVISAPKSAASRRTVRLTPSVANVLREHKLVSKRTDGLVFARANGTPEKLVNIVTFGLKAAMIRAGVTEPALDSEGKPLIGKNGKPVLRAKFSGLHVLRHWHASFCSNRKEDGGLGLPPKMVQERLGHSTSRSRSTASATSSPVATITTSRRKP
jgi:integrase